MSDSPKAVDGLTPAMKPVAEPQSHGKSVKKLELMMLAVASILYLLYIILAFGLMAILPSSDASLRPLVSLGLGSAALAALIFVGFGAVLLMHIAQSKAQPVIRRNALIRLVIFVVPGLAISALLPVMITRQPPISIEIVSPASSQDWVAPVSMTFGLGKALQTLAASNFHPIQYKWDINGDGKVDQETVEPSLTRTYDSQGVFNVFVTMIDAGGVSRTAGRRFIILKSVFEMSPPTPIVEKPVVFSLANLIPDPTTIVQVQWDFDGDGKVDQTATDPKATYTYFKTGSYKVSALIDLQNKTQLRYERTIQVVAPPPLPFPVELKNEPSLLVGSAPFAVLFHIETKEPVAQIDWDFGDGEQGQGRRIAHTFKQNGNYPVTVRVRTQSGTSADLATAVQIVDQLSLPDLTFTGTPAFNGDRIAGEVPLTINVTPKTSTAFVTFNWEAPGATEVGSTATSLQAIYRREGTYTLTLVAQDLNNHVLRKPITVQVNPPSALVTITMNPETGIAPLNVSFDASETSVPGDDITGFVWNFGDSSPTVTGGARISHVYTDPKTYNVSLTVQTAGGASYNQSRVLVVREPSLQACFTRSKNAISAGSSVQFSSDCVTGIPTSYLWDFGDGAQTDENNPVHFFAAAGTYNVQLTVRDAAGKVQTTSTSITVTP